MDRSPTQHTSTYSSNLQVRRVCVQLYIYNLSVLHNTMLLAHVSELKSFVLSAFLSLVLCACYARLSLLNVVDRTTHIETRRALVDSWSMAEEQ